MDEQRLRLAFQSRDPAAMQELVETLGPRLLRSAFLLCGNGTEAQDLVQDTFLQAIQSAHRFGGRSSVYTWLHGILLNLTRHYHRDRKRLVGADELVQQEPALAEDGPARLDTDLAATTLTEALRRLSAAHREVLVLRFFEEMKIHEIARHLSISRGTVKSRLHYAIAEMQKLLPAELNLFGAQGTNQRR